MIKNYIKKLCLLFAITMSLLSHANTPKIFAHKGGGGNFPENTLYAIESSIKAGCDGVEVDVQLTKDGQVVLYHPDDLAVFTSGFGPLHYKTLDELQKLDAGFNFKAQDGEDFPYRNKGWRIPTLKEVLKKFPETEIIVDMKSMPIIPLVDAVEKVVSECKAWKRVIFYSTQSDHLDYLRKIRPDAQVFENRGVTRTRLLTMRNADTCCCKDQNLYAGFELSRPLTVIERFKLGQDESRVEFKLWDERAMECTKNSAKLDKRVFLFTINDKDSLEKARNLGAYAVMTDKPLEILAK